MKSLIRRAGLLASAALAGTALALGGFAAPAQASPLVDGAQEGSLTVHKYETPDTSTGLPNNGTELTDAQLAELRALQGVEFSVQQVDSIDLSSNTGWDEANDLATAFDAANVRYADQAAQAIEDAGYNLAPAVTENTNSNGQAFFTGLDVGQYLVTETSYQAGITPSAPFLVTVPITNPGTSTDWLYDVHVYPKNSVVTADKVVSDGDDIAVGDIIDFTITAQIPNDDILDGYRIVDELDSRLTYEATTVELSSGTTITEGTHYTVTHDNGTVTVDFNATGRAVLAENFTADVVVNIQALVAEVGEIQNQAVVYPNAPSFDVEPGEPGGPISTPPVETRWGGVTIQKTDPAGNGLAGAQFSVYASEDDALNNQNPIELGGETEFAVNADGIVEVSGLRYSNWANGGQVADTDSEFQTYWLVETQAPEGYTLLAEPISFTVTDQSAADRIDLEVENVPHNAGFELPMTGASGTALIYLAGALLIAGAVLMTIRSKRRPAADTTV